MMFTLSCFLWAAEIKCIRIVIKSFGIVPKNIVRLLMIPSPDGEWDPINRSSQSWKKNPVHKWSLCCSDLDVSMTLQQVI
jgi:hypothetical protein